MQIPQSFHLFQYINLYTFIHQ